MAELTAPSDEDQFAAVFRLSPTAICITDGATGCYRDVNASFCSLTGYRREELVGRTSADLNLWVDPLLRERVQAGLQQAQVVRDIEGAIRDKSGTPRAVLASFQTVELSGERLVLSLLHDITDRQEMEAALRRQSGYLAALHETSLALLNRLDVGDVLRQIVIRATQLVGATQGLINIVDTDADTLMTAASSDAHEDRVGMRLSRGEGVAGRVWESGETLVIADYPSSPARVGRDETLPGAVVGVPLQVGAQVSGVLIVTRQSGAAAFVSEEVALLERFGQLAALALDNARLYSAARAELADRVRAEAQIHFQASLLDQVHNAVVAVDRERNVVYWNRFAEHLYGWTESEALGRKIDELVVVEEPRSVAGYASEPAVDGEHGDGVRQAHRKDGTIFPIYLSIAPLLDTAGIEIGSVGVAMDVTERQRTRLELAEQVQRQAMVTELGRLALSGIELNELFADTVRLGGLALGVSRLSILRLQPCGRELLLVAGAGWQADAVGTKTISAGLSSLAGQALGRNEPVLLADLCASHGFDDSNLARQGLRDGVAVPVVGRTATYGALVVFSNEPRNFSAEEVNFLVTVAHILSTAVERRDAEQALRVSEERFRALIERSSDGVLLFDVAGVITYVSPSAGRLLGYSPQEMLGRSGFEFAHPDDVRSPTVKVARWLAAPGAAVAHEFRYRHKDGSWRLLEGVLTNLTRDPAVGAYVMNFRDVTARAAAQVALEASENRFRSMVQNSADIIAVFDPEGMLRYISPSVERVMGYTVEELVGRPSLMLVHPDDRDASDEASARAFQHPAEPVSLSSRVRARDGSWHYLDFVITNHLADPAINGVVVNARDTTETHAAQAALGASEQRFRSLVQNASDVVAIVSPEGLIQFVSPAVERVLGYADAALLGESFIPYIHPSDRGATAEAFARAVAGSRSRVPFEFRFQHADGGWRTLEAITANLSDEPSVGGLVVNARDVTERVQYEQQLAHQAYHDPLTGLPNRALLADRIQHALARSGRGRRPVALLFLDLDRFKLVNDSLGHILGDELLSAAAQRLLDCVRPGDTVARFGGDEFAVLLEDGRQPHDAIGVAARIVECMRAPFPLAGHEVSATVSVGIAHSDGGPAEPTDLLRDADVALYRAKLAGGNGAVVFKPAMNARAVERLDLDADLRRALDRGELRLYYQPDVDLKTGVITGAEALLRWQHPTRGLLMPAEFIPLAEETGLIMPIGRWVLQEACRKANVWRRLRGGSPFLMSANLSARQFQQTDLVQQVEAALSASGLPAENLCLEITESVMMQSVEATLVALHELSRLGLKLAVDDFGTGYSSLSYLQRFPVSTLKIDRSFVLELHRSHEAAAIVQSVVALAHALGLEVTAEGIETDVHLARVRALGCDRGQGYHFARALPAEEFARLLSTGAVYAVAPIAA
ncbi:MAG: PAS domain S-box protein [Dehalococcoidia bacterium]